MTTPFNFASPRNFFWGTSTAAHQVEGGNKNENKITSDLGWELYPEGIYRVLTDLQKYHQPIYITENGLADARDQQRARYIRDILTWVEKTMRDGVDIRGYFHWSLIDNFEWDKGFWPRFGLIEVQHPSQKRIIRQSALEYSSIIRETDNSSS